MKQRLGVAAALLKDPELVVLDEPTNGLDPAGMRDMRRLIRELGASGRTVLLSSHLLGEVQQICDRVGVIDRGRMVAESTVDELRGGRRAASSPRRRPTSPARELEAMAERRSGCGRTTASCGSAPTTGTPPTSTGSWSPPASPSPSCGATNANSRTCSSR